LLTPEDFWTENLDGAALQTQRS